VKHRVTHISVIVFWLIVISMISMISSCALTYDVPVEKDCCNSITYNHTDCYDCQYNRMYNPNWIWWSWNNPVYTNYVIVKPNNKPNVKPNTNVNQSNNSNKPNRKPRRRK